MEKQHMTGKRGIERRVKRHVAAAEHEFFAVVQPGFENTARRELETLGVGGTIEIHEGGLGFRGRLETCYRVNLCSRAVSRVLMRIGIFRAEYFERFHDKLAEIPWELHCNSGQLIDFSITARKSRLYHTGRLEEEARKALAQRLTEYGMEPSFTESGETPSQGIYIRLDHDLVNVSLDTSGDELYKRGHKNRVGPAPLRETLAALILLEARVGEYDLVLDPLCGSGTFSLEAAGIATGSMPGMDRRFPFMDWPAFSPAAFNHLKKSLVINHDNPIPEKTKPAGIYASDRDPHAVETARSNIEDAGLQQIITTDMRDFFHDHFPVPEDKRCLIVMNPPYGGRLDQDNVRGFYSRIGRTIREHYRSCGFAIIVPGLEQEKALSLHWDRKILFMNGGIGVAALFRDGA